MTHADGLEALVRRMFQIFNECDWDGYLEICDPGVVTFAPPGWPEPGPQHGPDEVVGQYRRMQGAWGGDAVATPISIFSRGEWAICHMTLETRGGLSGADAATEFTVAVRERDGRLLEQRFVWGHVTPEQALGLD